MTNHADLNSESIALKARCLLHTIKVTFLITTYRGKLWWGFQFGNYASSIKISNIDYCTRLYCDRVKLPNFNARQTFSLYGMI